MVYTLFVLGFPVFILRIGDLVNKDKPSGRIFVIDSVNNFNISKMKITWFILIFVTGLISCSDEIVITEAEICSDLLYTSDNLSPFSGSCKVVYSKTGLVKEVLNYRKGRLDGGACYYYLNGNPKWKGFYKDGFISGKWECWDEEGSLVYIVNYEEDTLDGKFASYYPDGGIKEQGQYLNNSRTGEWIIYSEKGQIMSRKFY